MGKTTGISWTDHTFNIDGEAVETNDLGMLAQRIAAAHGRVQSACTTALTHAIEAGRLLFEAKAALPHGAWLPWLRAHCHLAERTAQVYMRLARKTPHLTAENPQRVADLSMRAALEDLATSRSAPEPQLFLQNDPAVIAATVEQWPDILHTFSVLLDAAGKTPPHIAEQLGVPLGAVAAYLDFQPPRRDLTAFERAGFTVAADIYRLTLESDWTWANMLAHGFAAYHAPREGYAALVPSLEGVGKHLLKRWKSVECDKSALYADIDQVRGRNRDSLRNVWIAAECCADSDFRTAVGLEPVTPDLMVMFGSFWDLASRDAPAA